MSNAQLYVAVGIPVLAILISLVIQLQAIRDLRREIQDLRRELNEIRAAFLKDHTERLVRLEERVFRSS